jgi:23S rRNA (uracil1939-C5)-methyltransferase
MTHNSKATLHLGAFDRHGTTRARYQNRWIEVEHGIPGEAVIAEVMGTKRQRARILEVRRPAADRVWPPCEYFRDWHCGGCQWQMISYEGQLERKREQINELMRDAGLELEVTATHALDDPWRYRSTAGIALGRNAGFRRQASLAIVPIHDCPISELVIGRLMARLNAGIDVGTIPDYRGRVRVDVRVIEGGRLQTMIRPADDAAPDTDLASLAAFLSDLEDVEGVAIEREGGAAEVLKGELFAPVAVKGKEVLLTAASFFQTNLRLLPELIDRICEEAAPLAGRRIADVYGGVGMFGLFLADAGARVTVIESDPTAVDAGRRTADRWDLASIEFVAADAGDALGDQEYDVIVVDPPRSGLTPLVIDSLIDEPPEVLLYVSCLPQSLARDLVPLTQASYRVEHLEMFDFYPQTFHIEALAVLRHGRSVTDATFGALNQEEAPVIEQEIHEAFAEHGEERDRRSRQL